MCIFFLCLIFYKVLNCHFRNTQSLLTCIPISLQHTKLYKITVTESVGPIYFPIWRTCRECVWYELEITFGFWANTFVDQPSNRLHVDDLFEYIRKRKYTNNNEIKTITRFYVYVDHLKREMALVRNCSKFCMTWCAHKMLHLYFMMWINQRKSGWCNAMYV